MKPTYTDHSERQMRRRQISEAAVEHILTKYDELTVREDGCAEYVGYWRWRKLLVVADETVSPPRIVTVYDEE